MPFRICELNQVSIMTTVKHSDFFFCIFSTKSSTIISFAVSSDLLKIYPFSLNASRMGKKSYTQPAACTEMGSVSVAIEWEGWHGDPAGEGAGPTVHEESISQRRMLAR